MMLQSVISRVGFTHEREREREILDVKLDFLTLDFIQPLVVLHDTKSDHECFMSCNHFLSITDKVRSQKNLLIS